MATRLPPGRFGPPMLGESLALYADPYAFVKQRYDRYGSVFRSGLVGKNAAVLLSAEAQKYVLVSHQENFLTHDGYAILDPLLGDALIMTDGPRHRQQKKWLTPAFHGRNMGGYLETMNRVIGARLDGWGADGQQALYPELAHTIFTLATALLLGIEFGSEQERLLGWWEAFAKGSHALIQIPGPFSTFGRALQARQRIDAFLRTLITTLRGTQEMNVVRLLTEARDEDGAALSAEDIVTQVRFLIFAGYESTTGTLTWLLTELLRHPDLMQRVRAEVRADDTAAPITMDDLQQRPLLDAVIQETLRLYPQTMLLTRGVVASFEIDGYTIPAKWLVFLAPILTHRMAQYFADPDRFDPDRFLAPREEATKTPFAYIGFGGGGHACLGETVAKLEMKALITALLRRFDLTLVPDQDLRVQYLPLTRPRSDVLVTYHTRG